MADGEVEQLDLKDAASSEEKSVELCQEAEYVSDVSGGYNDDEEGGCEDMAHMPDGEVIGDAEDDETSGGGDEEAADRGGPPPPAPHPEDNHDEDDRDDNGNNDEHDHRDDSLTDAKVTSGSDWVEEGEEREEGDGEEGYGEESSSQVAVTAKDKVLDFDEDRRNPQYIPKKGGFYEHDDRLGEEELPSAEATGAEDEKNKAGKKKLWKAEGKWEHDYFQGDEQAPKNRDELIATYGYDIRNEDGPPRARRRRRYGRGPMKYTRNWEDENAYGKPSSSSQRGSDGDDDRESFRGGYRGRRSSGRGSGYRGGGGRGGGRRGWNYHRDFENQEGDKSARNDARDKSLDDEGYEGYPPPKSSEYPDLPPVRSFDKTPSEISPGSAAADRGRRASRRNHATTPRGHGGGSSKNGPRPIVQDGHVTNELLSGFKKLTVNSDGNEHHVSAAPSREGRKEAKVAPTQHNASGTPHERRQATVPPRLQDSASNRPKRYSSQRQRQGGDPVQSDYQQPSARLQDPELSSMPPRFYEPSYQNSVYPDSPAATANVQHVSSGAPTTTLMPQHYQGYEARAYQDTYAIRPMATPPSRAIFNPVSLAAAAAANGQQQQQQQQQQASVIPAPFIPATMSYGPPPPPAYPPPQYHHHQHQPQSHHQQQYAVSQFVAPAPPPPVSQPQEIFRCGMAYYNAPPPVRTLPKRPRAAIPIVPPPDLEDQRKDDSQECNSVTLEHLEHYPEQAVNADN